MSKQLMEYRKNLFNRQVEKPRFNDIKDAYSMGIINKKEYTRILVRHGYKYHSEVV